MEVQRVCRVQFPPSVEPELAGCDTRLARLWQGREEEVSMC